MRSGRVFLIAVWHCNLFTGRSYGGVVAKQNRWSLCRCMALFSMDSIVYTAFHVFFMCAKSVLVCSMKSYFATIKLHEF